MKSLIRLRIKMRVLHIITGLTTGGAETVLYRLCCYDKVNSHIVVSLQNQGKYIELLREKGIPVYAMDFSYQLNVIRKLIALSKLIKKQKPDLVQTWLYHADLFGGISAKLAGVKHIFWTIHNSTLSKTQTPFFTRLIVYLLAFLSYVIPCHIISCGEKARLIHIKKGYDARKISVIFNGYDTEIFKPNPSLRGLIDGIRYEQPLIGMVARYSAQKDHENLFKALSILKTRGIRLKCVLVGTNMDDDNKQLIRQIHDNRIEDYIILKGEQNNLQNLLPALDLHVLSSAYGEAFPNVICEAMSCGVPCISTNLGDIPFIIGDTGYVVPPSNPNALADAIEKVVHQKNTNKQRIRERIVRDFNINTMVKSYTSTWKKFVS